MSKGLLCPKSSNTFHHKLGWNGMEHIEHMEEMEEIEEIWLIWYGRDHLLWFSKESLELLCHPGNWEQADFYKNTKIITKIENSKWYPGNCESDFPLWLRITWNHIGVRYYCVACRASSLQKSSNLVPDVQSGPTEIWTLPGVSQIGDSMVSRENVTINYSNLITKLNDMSRHAPEFTHPTIQTRPSDDNDWMCSWPVLRALRVGFKGFEGFKGLRAWWRPWQCSWQGFEGNVEFLSSRSSPLDEVSKDFLWKTETIQINSRTKYKEKKIPKCTYDNMRRFTRDGIKETSKVVESSWWKLVWVD